MLPSVRMSAPYYDSATASSLSRLPRDLVRHRWLLWSLISKELRARYRNAAIGFSWAILHPLLMMLVLTFVFTRIFDIRGSLAGESLYADQPYALVILCALIFWQFTANAIVAGTSSLIANHGLITKVYFPREVIPLASVGDSAINCLIGLALLLGLQTAFGVPPGINLLFVPIVFGIQVAMLAGLTLLLSMMNALFRDIRYVVEVAVLFAFYVTPVFYEISWPREALPAWAFQLYSLNPMVGLIAGYRQAILGNQMPDWTLLAWPAAFAVLVCIAGAILFRKRSATIADYV